MLGSHGHPGTFTPTIDLVARKGTVAESKIDGEWAGGSARRSAGGAGLVTADAVVVVPAGVRRRCGG
jgi:hypothetical protein